MNVENKFQISNNNPEISVVLPYYNAESTLKRAVESILRQTFTNFELLLVDNNSNDKSSQIAKYFAKNDTRIRLLKEANKGVAHAMNRGLSSARGKFLARMDADDVSSPHRLKEQVSFLNEHPEIDFVGSKVKYISHIKNSAGFERFVNWTNTLHTSKEIEINRFVEIPIINPTIIFRKSIFEKYGGCLDNNLPEDYEMQLRYLDAGIRMAKLEKPLLEWHDYSNRLTRTNDRYSSEAFFRAKAKYFKNWSAHNNRFHPKIWVWGAGRKTRQRARLFEQEGLIIDGFIDIVKRKNPGKTTIHFTEVPDPGKIFIVPMVTKYGARSQIKEFLTSAQYTEGKDFMLMG